MLVQLALSAPCAMQLASAHIYRAALRYLIRQQPEIYDVTVQTGEIVGGIAAIFLFLGSILAGKPSFSSPHSQNIVGGAGKPGRVFLTNWCGGNVAVDAIGIRFLSGVKRRGRKP